jgi:hypothetical protein
LKEGGITASYQFDPSPHDDMKNNTSNHHEDAFVAGFVEHFEQHVWNKTSPSSPIGNSYNRSTIPGNRSQMPSNNNSSTKSPVIDMFHTDKLAFVQQFERTLQNNGGASDAQQ